MTLKVQKIEFILIVEVLMSIFYKIPTVSIFLSLNQ
jgi:hypothetical protein